MVYWEFIYIFVPIQLALRDGWVKTYWIPYIAHRRTSLCNEPCRKRTFSERYLLLTQLRNLILPEDTATRRPHRAFITPNLWSRVVLLCHADKNCYAEQSEASRAVHRRWSFINRTAWAGWVAYLGKRAMRRPVSGISKEVSPTSFLCPYVERIHNHGINL